jgi:ankyrin repeat protein
VAKLFEACDRGDLAAVEAVLRAASGSSLDVSAEDRAQRTPLMFAARAGSLPAVQLLHARGADAGACDKDGRNALHYSARRGHVDVVAWLLARGLSVQQTDVHALTPLHQSVLGKSAPVATLLLRAW